MSKGIRLEKGIDERYEGKGSGFRVIFKDEDNPYLGIDKFFIAGKDESKISIVPIKEEYGVVLTIMRGCIMDYVAQMANEGDYFCDLVASRFYEVVSDKREGDVVNIDEMVSRAFPGVSLHDAHRLIETLYL